MGQQWVGMPPDGMAVRRVCGVCFDAEDRVLALRVGMRLTLPATSVHGAEDPGAALAAWLAQRGVHVRRSGPMPDPPVRRPVLGRHARATS